MSASEKLFYVDYSRNFFNDSLLAQKYYAPYLLMTMIEKENFIKI